MKRVIASCALLLLTWPAQGQTVTERLTLARAEIDAALSDLESQQDDHGDHGGHGDHAMHQPPPSRDVLVGSIEPIASNFSTFAWIERGDEVPGGDGDEVGAFRFICNVAGYGYVDPLVFPGVRDKTRVHLHMFFGNDAVTEHSTHASLRATGGSSCQGGPTNRSGYWMPAMLNGRGQAVTPSYIAVYYKRWPKDSPQCRTVGRECVDLPRGLNAIFGTNYAIGAGQNTHVRYDCEGQQSSTSLTEAGRACRNGGTIAARIFAPPCWDGRRIDSPDHQAHLAYASYTQPRGEYKCPATHPYVMPEVTFIAVFPIKAGDDPTQWAFSSDVMLGKPAGSTFHADYMEAWDPAIARAWHGNCLDKKLSCSGGHLGNGQILKAPPGFTFDQQPHLVPIPER